MNVSSLQTQKAVSVAEASKGIPSITISSTPDPTNTQSSIGKSSYLRNFLLNPSEKLPAPSTPEERKVAVEVSHHLGYLTAETFNDPSKGIQSQAFCSYCQNELHKLGLQRFTWDWKSSWHHPFNELMTILFYHTFLLALVSTESHHFCWDKDQNIHGVVSSLME
ncbi:hypothetical protein O181_044403 [Austropuccinia psidii MF-1]|uniref:Uncharacterized protein n=1 Tax=Austropuccinia psidii MF-1 TaxID=1389203 RepID=A0A9Q3DQ10_9BASI|nr:hypothetical protein [Austropuccinia psidii MF-1]